MSRASRWCDICGYRVSGDQWPRHCRSRGHEARARIVRAHEADLFFEAVRIDDLSSDELSILLDQLVA